MRSHVAIRPAHTTPGPGRAGGGRSARDRRALDANGSGGRGADRGSVTILVLFFTIMALALASLLVDVGNALNARERAADIAEQAARAGANDINVAALRAGRLEINAATACGRAVGLVAAYSARTGWHARASCQPPSARQITVTVFVTTHPVIAASLGNFTVHASATAEPVCGITLGGQC
jgi:putative Flp pilus-assembly TadE/G-like protein